MPLNIRPLPKILAEKATRELNEVAARVPEDIETLREWIVAQPHIRSPLDDQFLIAFLRGSKYSLQKAKEKIDLFFTARELTPEFSKLRDPLLNTEIIKLGTLISIPQPISEDGPIVHIVRPGSYDASKYDMVKILKMNTMYVDIMLMEDDNFMISGTIGILDLANVTRDHFAQFHPHLARKLMKFRDEALPFRQKGYHYINTPPQFDTMFNMIKGFMSEKNQKRLYVHKTLDTLYNFIPKRILPTEYGGEAGPLQNFIDRFEQRLIENREYLINFEKYGIDERARVHKSQIVSDLHNLL